MTDTITISLVYADSSSPEHTTCGLRANCAQAALNTLVYHIQRETVSLSGFARIKRVTKRDARRLAERLYGKTNALNIITDFTAAILVTSLNASIDAALAEANATLTKPRKQSKANEVGPIIHLVK